MTRTTLYRPDSTNVAGERRGPALITLKSRTSNRHLEDSPRKKNREQIMGVNNDPNKSPQTSLPKVKSNNYAAFERDSELNVEQNQ